MVSENDWIEMLTRRVTRRRLLSGAAGIGAGLVVACAGGSTLTPAAGTASGKAPKKGGTLRWGIESDIATLDPVWNTAYVTAEVAAQLYDPLLVYDAGLKPQPVLLKDYTVSTDRLTYTFNLREDATFEGGRPITSADVVASIERWGKKMPVGVSLFTAVNSLQAKGDRTFVLETKEPYSLVIDSLTAGGGGPFIMTREAASTSPDQRVDDVTASGPFRLAEWTKGSKIVLKPRADYKSPAGAVSNLAGARTVYLDALEIPIIPDDTSRLSALQAGTIDVMTVAPSDYFEQLTSDPQVEVKPKDGGYFALLLNHTRPPFNNPLARRAVLAALDVDKFMAAGVGKLWKSCPAVFLCGTPNESQASIDRYNQKNLAGATQLFQQLQQSGGYDGRPVVVLSNTTFTANLNQSQVTKQLLESIGFKVDLQTPDWPTATSLRANKDKWDLFHTGAGGGVNPPGMNDPLRSQVLSAPLPSSGWYQSAELQELKRQYARATTPEQQKAAIDKVQTLWYTDVPALLLGVSQPYDALRTYVKGFANVPVPFVGFWNVWLDK